MYLYLRIVQTWNVNCIFIRIPYRRNQFYNMKLMKMVENIDIKTVQGRNQYETNKRAKNNMQVLIRNFRSVIETISVDTMYILQTLVDKQNLYNLIKQKLSILMSDTRSHAVVIFRFCSWLSYWRLLNPHEIIYIMVQLQMSFCIWTLLRFGGLSVSEPDRQTEQTQR